MSMESKKAKARVGLGLFAMVAIFVTALSVILLAKGFIEAVNSDDLDGFAEDDEF